MKRIIAMAARDSQQGRLRVPLPGWAMEECPGLGAVKRDGGRGWWVMHLPSGAIWPYTLPSRDVAIDLIRVLAHGADWTAREPDRATLRESVRRASRWLYEQGVVQEPPPDMLGQQDGEEVQSGGASEE